MPVDLATLRSRLRVFALSLPGAYEEFPWGERVVKVAKKVFVFLGKDGDDTEAGLSVKLPASRDMALTLPFARPTEYGLGKSGWVTARFTRADAPPLDLLTSWIDESYRAVAPKKLVATLGGGAAAAPPRRKTAPKRASPAKKSVTKSARKPAASARKAPTRRRA